MNRSYNEGNHSQPLERLDSVSNRVSGIPRVEIRFNDETFPPYLELLWH